MECSDRDPVVYHRSDWASGLLDSQQPSETSSKGIAEIGNDCRIRSDQKYGSKINLLLLQRRTAVCSVLRHTQVPTRRILLLKTSLHIEKEFIRACLAESLSTPRCSPLVQSWVEVSLLRFPTRTDLSLLFPFLPPQLQEGLS